MRYLDRSLDAEAALREVAAVDPRVRIRAADALGRVEGELIERACQALRLLLRDERSDVRYTAALSLGELRDAGALAELREQMEGDGHPLARQAAVIALGLIGDPRATPPLVAALQGGPPEVRFQAATSLAQGDPAAAREPLRRALADSDAEVRAAAVAALGTLEPTVPVKIVARLLEDPAPAVRLEAALFLARRGDRRGTPVLLSHLARGEGRLVAAEHLCRCPDPEATAALRTILGGWLEPPLLKVWCAAALARLGEAEGRSRLCRLLRSRRLTVRGLAIQVLGELGEVWALDALRELAASPAGDRWQEEIDLALDGR